MDGVDIQFQKFGVAIAAGLALHVFDLVVRAFQEARGNRMVVPRLDTHSMRP